MKRRRLITVLLVFFSIFIFLTYTYNQVWDNGPHTIGGSSPITGVYSAYKNYAPYSIKTSNTSFSSYGYNAKLYFLNTVKMNPGQKYSNNVTINMLTKVDLYKYSSKANGSYSLIASFDFGNNVSYKVEKITISPGKYFLTYYTLLRVVSSNVSLADYELKQVITNISGNVLLSSTLPYPIFIVIPYIITSILIASDSVLIIIATRRGE